MSESASPQLNGEELIGGGKWLKLMKFHYTDENRKQRVWETLVRTTHGQAEVDAVEIVPILRKKGEISKLVVIKQFRPPTGKYIIELPSGLVDAKEDIVTAALRELREETGFVGTIVDKEQSFELFLGMAISNTTSQVCAVDIDGDLPENMNPIQELDEGEFAQVILIPTDKIIETLKEFKNQGLGIDGKIWLLAYGMQLGRRL